jgi:nitrogen fixation/metabolism regulation signal transduction histidine kinase
MNFMVLNNTTAAWLTAIGIALGVTLALVLTKKLVIHHLRRFAGRTETKLDDIAVDALAATRLLPIAIIGLFIGSKVLELAPG